MTVTPVLKLAADTLLSVLGDRTHGFNANLAEAWRLYSVNGPAFKIDYVAASKNFFQSNVGVLDIFDEDSTALPAQCLFENTADNQNVATSNIFSGPMSWILDTHLIWPQGRAVGFHLTRRAVSDALINLFNGDFAQLKFAPSGLAWNGAISLQFSPLSFVEDKSIWMQSIRASLQFNVTVK